MSVDLAIIRGLHNTLRLFLPVIEADPAGSDPAILGVKVNSDSIYGSPRLAAYLAEHRLTLDPILAALVVQGLDGSITVVQNLTSNHANPMFIGAFYLGSVGQEW